MAKEKLVRPTLPEKTDPDYVEALVDACITAFEKFGDDGMSLNYMGVDGKLRPMVLDNPRYKQETRKIMAEKFLEEIEEIESISETLKSESPRESNYDIRNPKEAESFTKDIKDTLTLRLKVADMRRDVLSITKNKEVEENDALNIFFISLTAEEFAAMDNVEIHEGTETAELTNKEKEKAAKAKKRFGDDEEDNEPDPFIIAADGSIEEIFTQ
jgi:hypothetical protein